MRYRERLIYIPAEVNSNADWIKCSKALSVNHLMLIRDQR